MGAPGVPMNRWMQVLVLLLATAMLAGPVPAASAEAGRSAASADGRVVLKATNAPAVGCDPLTAPLFRDGFELDRAVSVGPTGATVTSPNGTCAVIPAGALASVTDIRIAVAAAGTAPAFPPAGITPLGDINAFTPHGTTFSQPVTIRVPFNPAAVPAGTTPRLYRAEPGGSFAAVAGATVNGSFLEAQVSGFSFFGAGMAPPPPPTITPITLSAASVEAVNGSITASVSFTGDPVPDVEWEARVGTGAWVRLGGVTPIGGGCQLAGGVDPGGAIVLVQISTACSPSFSLRATAVNANGRSATVSTTVPVTPPTAPTISQPPSAQTITAGGAATFSVTVSGSGALTYTWTLNGSAVSSGPLEVGACQANASTFIDVPSLSLTSVSIGCNGATIGVTVSNGINPNATATTTLTVNGSAPLFTTQPVSQPFTTGGSATFVAAASGTPTPTYTWRINGNMLAPVTVAAPLPAALAPCTGSYTQSGGTLSLTNLSNGCNGVSLSVRASNSVAIANSNVVTLTLGNPAPTNLAVSSNAPRDEGQTVTASVTATGNDLTYQWMLDFDRFNITSTVRTIPDANAASYTTPILTRGYNGAALQVRVCSGAQPFGSGPAPNCALSSLVVPLGQTFAIGAQGACFGGPTGWCYRSPTPQGNDLTGVVLPTDSEPMIAVGYGTVLESNDSGTNWTARFPTPRLDFRGLARGAFSTRLMAPVAASTTPTAVTGGVYVSDDRGATWRGELLVTAPEQVNDVALFFAGTGLTVAVGTGIWIGSASGTDWSQVSTAAFSPPESLLRVEATEFSATVFAVSDAGGILRSTDGGFNWSRVYSGAGARLIDVARDGSTVVVVVEDRDFVLLSTDGGETWMQRPVPTSTAQAVGISPFGTFLLIDDQSRVIASIDFGQSWTETSTPVEGSVPRWRLATDAAPGSELIAVGAYGAMLRSSFSGAFQVIGGGNGTEAAITSMETSPSGRLLMVRGARIGRSTDGGVTWSGFGQPGQHVSWVSDSLAFAALNSAGDATLYRSDDAGQNWSGVGVAGDTLTGLSMINSNAGILIGTRAGVPRVFRIANGTFWEPIFAQQPSGFVPRSVRALNPGVMTTPLTAVVLVGGDDGRLLRTTDGGQLWQEVGTGSTGRIRHIARVSASSVILAADDGLFASNDSGQSWTQVYDSSATGAMLSVAARAGGGRCVATGMVGLLVGDCGTFNLVDQPHVGVLRAAAWPATNNALAGGDGGTLLINRNQGLPAESPARFEPFASVGTAGTRSGNAAQAPASVAADRDHAARDGQGPGTGGGGEEP